MGDTIDSIKDERITAARALTSRAGRRADGRCLLEGESLIGQALDAGATIEYALCAAGTGGPQRGALDASNVPVHDVRPGLLRQITGSSKPVTWLAVAAPTPEAFSDAPYAGDFVMTCEGISDPGNLGTVVRTARALGVRDIVLTDEDTDLTSRRALDAARGASLTAHVRRFPDPATAVRELRSGGYQVVATSPRGRHPQSLAPLRGDRVALVIGNETSGVSEETLDAADLVVQIPMAGTVESLNVGVAAGISIYELRMRMVWAMLTDRIRATLGRDLNVSGRFARHAFDTRLREVGDLDGLQVLTLMIVACERRTACADLRRDLGVTGDELGAVLTPLLERGYVTRDDDAVAATDSGEHAVAALWAVQERTEDELFAGFSENERTLFRDMLRRIQDNALRISQSGAG